jgi:GNAT superfamily N-acetyltransferase
MIRPAKREDIAAIVSISLSSVSDEEVAGFGRPVAQSVFGSVDRLSAEWNQPNRVGTEEVVVAELDGRVVGVATIEDRGDALELVDIDVLREMQGRGIGTELVGHVEELASSRGKSSVTLGTSRNSAGVPWRSFPWWQARGYMVTHEEQNDWTKSIGPGVREIRMRKTIGQRFDPGAKDAPPSQQPL